MTFLDTLVNDTPEGGGAADVGLLEGVRRDLEDLLNTRRRCVGAPPEYAQLQASLISYGLPDFTGADLGAPENRQQFCRVIEATISAFEPRLKNVKVDEGDTGDLNARFVFRIQAVIRSPQGLEEVVFDSALERATSAFAVRNGDA